MQNPRRWPTIVILIAMQIAWVFVVASWVVWYIQYRTVKMQPIGVWDIVIITEVAVLFILILLGIYILFILYQRQLTLMRTQLHIISSITHAFKTPLTTMQLYLETIRKRDLPGETREELLNGMLGETQKLTSLVFNFLESARLGTTNRPYTFTTIDASELVRTFIAGHEPLLKDVGLELNLEEGVPVRVDIDAFSMALANLMENAVHYSPESPRVGIRVWKEGTHAFIEFSDSGIGIARDNVKDVFRMFKRLPEAITLWGSGTGMGLYVVKGIVKAHGGKIWVDPNSETAGTSFLIRLPLART
ncbi:MAG TPA: HAMP domain-containing histidine kinase [Deltaproteobacteria bacterium]|nr:HAMP domain-containing histidine kinase [Deltaproteobacteria bacterium]